MVVKSVAINAYQNAMDVRRKSVNNTVTKSLAKPQEPVQGFSETLKESVHKVKRHAGREENDDRGVRFGQEAERPRTDDNHAEAGLAMSMTSAVRSKLMSSYQEIMRMPF